MIDKDVGVNCGYIGLYGIIKKIESLRYICDKFVVIFEKVENVTFASYKDILQ